MHKFAEAYHWTPEQVGDLTFYQLYAILGNTPKPDHSDLTADEIAARLKQFSGA